MSKLLLGVVVAVALIWIYITYGPSFNLPSLSNALPFMQQEEGYPYTCNDGTKFRMVPAEDVSSVRIIPTANAGLFPVPILQAASSTFGTRFEGGGVAFVGKGESVQLIGASFSTVCTPVPSQTEPPFNWGD
jgi:hypothetical protein